MGGRVIFRGFWVLVLLRVIGCVAGDVVWFWIVLFFVGLGWFFMVGVIWGCGFSWGLVFGR